MLKRWLLLFSLGFWGNAFADNFVDVCRAYGCVAQDKVGFTDAELSNLGAELRQAGSPKEERAIVANVIGKMYQIAGRQSLIRFDRAGNYFDDHPSGKTYCIDHSQTTTRFLRLLESHGYLHWHRVLDPVVRKAFYIFDHFSAAIETNEGEQIFVVDSWFVEQGESALVFPLKEWMQGAGPDV